MMTTKEKEKLETIYNWVKQLKYDIEKLKNPDILLNVCIIKREIEDLLHDGTYDAVFDAAIEELNVSKRSLNCLKYARIKTIRELINYPAWNTVRNLGPVTATEIANLLTTLGLKELIPIRIRKLASSKNERNK